MIFQNLFEENEQLRISQFYSLFNAIPGSTSVGVWVRWHQCACQGIYLGSSVIFLLFCCPDGYILLIYESQTLLSLLPVKPQTFYHRNKPEIFLHYWLNTYHSCFSLRSAQKDREQRAASWYTSEPTWNPPDRLNTVLLHPCCHLSLLAPPVIVWSHTEVAWIRETFRDVSTSMLRMALLNTRSANKTFILNDLFTSSDLHYIFLMEIWLHPIVFQDHWQRWRDNVSISIQILFLATVTFLLPQCCNAAFSTKLCFLNRLHCGVLSTKRC